MSKQQITEAELAISGRLDVLSETDRDEVLNKIAHKYGLFNKLLSNFYKDCEVADQQLYGDRITLVNLPQNPKLIEYPLNECFFDSIEDMHKMLDNLPVGS